MGLLQQNGEIYRKEEQARSVSPITVELAVSLGPQLIIPMAQAERRIIESALILCQGNISKAARQLDVSRSGLINKLNLYLLADGESRTIEKWRRAGIRGKKKLSKCLTAD